MNGTREGAIGRAHASYDDGHYLAALRDAGVEVPGEMSVLSFDDDECLAYLEVPVASVQTQAEPDGHQGGADGGEEFEDQAGEQRDPQGGQRSRADLFARGGHGPLVVGGPAKGPEQRQALHQRVEAVAEALEAGQPAPDRGRGVRPDQPGQDRRDHQGQRS